MHTMLASSPGALPAAFKTSLSAASRLSEITQPPGSPFLCNGGANFVQWRSQLGRQPVQAAGVCYRWLRPTRRQPHVLRFIACRYYGPDGLLFAGRVGTGLIGILAIVAAFTNP